MTGFPFGQVSSSASIDRSSRAGEAGRCIARQQLDCGRSLALSADLLRSGHVADWLPIQDVECPGP